MSFTYTSSNPMCTGAKLYIDGKLLTDLVIPAGIESISDNAFYGCPSLVSVTLPNSITSIGSHVFGHCSNLSTVTLPSSLSSVGSYAFDEDSKLAKVFYLGTENDWSGISISYGNDRLSSATRFYVSDYTDIYQITLAPVEHGTATLSETRCAPNTQITVAVRPEAGYRFKQVLVDGTAIEGLTFAATGNHTITVLFERYGNAVASGACGTGLYWCLYDTGELSVAGVGEMPNFNYWYNNDANAWQSGAPWSEYATDITLVTVGTGISYVGSDAFRDLPVLSEVSMPHEITAIGANAFRGCTALSAVSLPSSLQSIGQSAFYNCTKLDNIVIPSEVTDIGVSAFAGCTTLSEIEIPAGVTAISNSAFQNCSKLASVMHPDALLSIGNNAFYECNSLEAVSIPNGVKTVGEYAFYGCDTLTSAALGTSVASIGANAFGYCSAQKTVV